jgi:mRNA interferase MazF
MVKAIFVPDAGDFVWLTFDPQAGREQAGRRPALVLSPRVYNSKSGLALACAVTNQVKGYPFEVAVPAGCGPTGAVLADHLKSIDWKAHHAERLGRCPDEVLGEVRARLAPLLGF